MSKTIATIKDYWQIIAFVATVVISFVTLRYDVSAVRETVVYNTGRIDKHEARQIAVELVSAQSVVKMDSMQKDVSEVKNDVNEIQKDIKTLLRAK